MDDEEQRDDEATTVASRREPGWYRHSSGPGGHRYWDGRTWADESSTD